VTDITPIPQTFPIVDKNGYYTVIFKTFLDNLLGRVGGITGGSYSKLNPTSTGPGTASVLWDLNGSPVGFITLTVPNTTITTINQVAGGPIYRLTLIQDAVGGRLVTWGPEFKWPSGVAPTLSTAANAVDEISWDSDGTNMKFFTGVKDIR
jgi:hypothetical protein